MDVKKISLFLSGKLPPYYGDSNLVRFQRVVSRDFNELYNLNDLDLFLKQSNWIEEKFFQNILDDLYIEFSNDESRFNDFLKKVINNQDFINELFSNSEKQNLSEIWNKLKEELKTITGWKKDAKKFEDYCEKLIKFLLEDSFNEFKYSTQQKNDSGLDIPDWLLLNIYKDEWLIKNLWWDVIKNLYTTNTVVIEIKNYTEKANQDIITSTTKYLNKPHTWRFALIFTRKWLSKTSGEKKQILDFISNSLCFIVFDDDDYNKMINIKINWWSIESYILDKYFELSSKA